MIKNVCLLLQHYNSENIILKIIIIFLRFWQIITICVISWKQLFNKCQFRWVLVITEYDFEIKYYFKKIHSIDNSSRRSNYKEKTDYKICLFILQNKLKNMTVVVVSLIFVIIFDFEKTLTERTKSVSDKYFFF